MAHPIKNPAPFYTYADYLTWPEDERWEIIEGVPYNMSPAPGTRHQKLLVELVRVFSNYLKGKTCEVYTAPFDVRVPKKRKMKKALPQLFNPI